MTCRDAPPTCATCLFWTGNCRRRAPIAAVYPHPVTGEPVTITAWPETAADDVCGEWARATAAKEG